MFNWICLICKEMQEKVRSAALQMCTDATDVDPPFECSLYRRRRLLVSWKIFLDKSYFVLNEMGLKWWTGAASQVCNNSLGSRTRDTYVCYVVLRWADPQPRSLSYRISKRITILELILNRNRPRGVFNPRTLESLNEDAFRASCFLFPYKVGADTRFVWIKPPRNTLLGPGAFQRCADACPPLHHPWCDKWGMDAWGSGVRG